MSLASVRSTRGDSYEILIAARWAMQMLSGAEIKSIAVDSTELDASGECITVDDVVVSYHDARTTYCQCKKNSVDFLEWQISALANDLQKAARQLVQDPHATVAFYSTVPFGEVQKLQEHSNVFASREAFRANLTRDQQSTVSRLSALWSDWLSDVDVQVFDFLQRITFDVTPSQPRLRDDIKDMLRHHVTHADDVLDQLSGLLVQLKSRTAYGHAGTQSLHVLTREVLLQRIRDAGAVHTPPREEADLLREFRSASAVGRAWRRDIGSRRLVRVALSEVLTHIESGSRRILICDGPGSGKTCLLLDLLERLESQPGRAVLFVQGREFAEAVDDAERRALGMPSDVLSAVARMAEYRPVVVIIDSVDVLSLAREHGPLRYFLSLIDRLFTIPDVTVVAACRSFDLKYDLRLANCTWDKRVALGPLDWQTEVAPLLSVWHVDAGLVDERLQAVLTNPYMLAIFEELCRNCQPPLVETGQQLIEQYLEAVVSRERSLGEAALRQLEALGQQMLAKRQLSVPMSQAGLPDEMKAALLSAGVLVQNASRGLEFGHQTLLDVLAVRGALRSGQSLLAFIRGHAATPFLRPAVRSFFFHLRSTDPIEFRRQVRAVVDANDIAFHLKRLVAESIAEVVPTEDDWRLISYLVAHRQELFRFFLLATRQDAWFAFFQRNWWPMVIARKDSGSLLTYANHLEVWVSNCSRSVLEVWLDILAYDWTPKDDVTMFVGSAMTSWSDWKAPSLPDLFAAVMDLSTVRNIFMGQSLARWVEANDAGDELLWRYLISDVEPDDSHYRRVGAKLRCGPNRPGLEQNFLTARMRRSEVLGYSGPT